MKLFYKFFWTLLVLISCLQLEEENTTYNTTVQVSLEDVPGTVVLDSVILVFTINGVDSNIVYVDGKNGADLQGGGVVEFTLVYPKGTQVDLQWRFVKDGVNYSEGEGGFSLGDANKNNENFPVIVLSEEAVALLSSSIAQSSSSQKSSSSSLATVSSSSDGISASSSSGTASSSSLAVSSSSQSQQIIPFTVAFEPVATSAFLEGNEIALYLNL